MTPLELMVLRAYAQGRRAPLKATELIEVRLSLAAAGLVRDCSHAESPMYVTATAAGLAALEPVQLGLFEVAA